MIFRADTPEPNETSQNGEDRLEEVVVPSLPPPDLEEATTVGGKAVTLSNGGTEGGEATKLGVIPEESLGVGGEEGKASANNGSRCVEFTQLFIL